MLLVHSLPPFLGRYLQSQKISKIRYSGRLSCRGWNLSFFFMFRWTSFLKLECLRGFCQKKINIVFPSGLGQWRITLESWQLVIPRVLVQLVKASKFFWCFLAFSICMDQQLDTLKYFVLAIHVSKESPEKKKNILNSKTNKRHEKGEFTLWCVAELGKATRKPRFTKLSKSPVALSDL